MDVSAVSGMAAAQTMFAVAAQAAAGVTASAPAAADGNIAEALQVAVLHKALESERSLVNILA